MAQDYFDPARAVSIGGGNDDFDPGRAELSKPAGGTASDLAKSIKVGTQRLPGMVTGLADLPFALAAGARPFTKAADALGEVTGFQPGKWADETKFSAGYEQGKKAVDDAWKDGSAGDIALAYLKNPGYTANQVVESAPGMVAGGMAGRALMGVGRVAAPAARAGGVGPAIPGLAERALGQWAAPVAAGVGEGAVTAGQQMAQYQGEDQQKNALASLGAGAVTGLVGVGAGRVANKLGLETAETAIAKAGTGAAKAADDVPLSAKRRILGGMVSEALLQELPQSAQEQMWQNWADGKPLMEGVARAATEGAIAGGVMGAGANVSDGGAGKRRALAEQQAKQLSEAEADALRADPSRAWTTEPGATDPNQPVVERAVPPVAPELQTIPGAAGLREGLDFTRDVDTTGLTLEDPAEVERARAATMDYEPADATPQWDTTRGAAAQDRQPGLDMPSPEFDTGALGLVSRSSALMPSQRMGIDPAAGPLSKAAAVSVDSGASQEAQFLAATGRDLQVRRTGPGVADDSNVIDVQGRVVEDSAIGTQRRLTAQESARESGAIAFREGVPRSEIAAIPNIVARAEQLRGYDDAAQKASSVPALPAPTNLSEGLERIRAQRQEAANAQAAARQAAAAAQTIPAARPGAVEAAGPATIPATTGVARESQASQAQQGSTQPTQAGGPQAGAATATASTSPAGGNRVQAAGLTNGAPTQNPGAQAAPAAGTQAQAPQAAVARPDGWRKSMLKAGPVAKAMGIDLKGKRLAQVVAEIDAADAQSGGAVNTMRGLAQQFRDRHAITKQDTDRTFAAVLDQFAGEVEQGKRTPQSVQQAIARYQELAAQPVRGTPPTAPATAVGADSVDDIAAMHEANGPYPPSAATRIGEGQWLPAVKTGPDSGQPIAGAPTFSDASSAAAWAGYEQAKGRAGADVAALQRLQDSIEGRQQPIGETDAAPRNLRMADERAPGAAAPAQDGAGPAAGGAAPAVGDGRRAGGSAAQPAPAVRAAVPDAGGASEQAAGVAPAQAVEAKEDDAGNVVMFSRAPATKAAYEARIDALFAGEKAAGPNSGVRVLDRSDVLGLLGFGEGPVNLAEGKVIKGQTNHQRMTAEQWKKVPEWLDNPAAVFDSDTVPGALVLIAPETINGATVRMTVEPRKDGGADVHILINAYDAPGFTPFARWFREGLGRLVDQKKFPAVLGDSGLQLSSSTWQNKPGMRNILTEKHLDGYRRKNSPAAMSRTVQPLRTPAATIRAAITKAYGKLLGQLESKGLVTLTQTEDEAIDAAAQARADKTGGDVEAIKRSMATAMQGETDVDVKRSANGAIQGFFDPQTGQSFLVADNLTAEAAPGVLMHEVGIHMAADGSMKALFNRAAMMLKMQRGNPFMKAVQARMDAAGETSGEEAAAYIAEAYENDRANAPASVQRWLADLLAAVKAWMFKKGIMGADRLTVADIAAVARANARSMARDGGATGGQGFGPAFSVGEEVGAKALAEFSKADELFALPKSGKDTVSGIAADIDPEITVRVTRLPGETMYTLSHPAFGVARITERSGNPYGPSLYGYNQVDGEITDQITERPGDNPEDVEPGTGDVWVDVSLLKPGQGGEKIYAIAANYAHNTGQIFIGDPAGLSKVALRRRLEQMLSSALKFGTTAHLAPHPDQVRGGDGVPPLQWVYGDHVGNVERMIAASVKALDNAMPTSKLIAYDPDRGFYRTDTGRSLARGQLAFVLKRSASEYRLAHGAGAAGQAGWRTIARAALFRHLQSTIAAAHGGLQERGRLLAGAGANVSRLHSDGTTGPVGSDQERATRIFYSRAGVSNTGGQAATGWDAPVQTGFDDVIYKLQDKNIDLKRVVESITKATGKVSDSINAYLKEELFHKRAAKRVADFGDRELKPLMNKMRLAGLSMEDVEEYLHARHAKEANAVIAQRNPGNAGLQDGGSGMTNAAADNYFAKLDPAQRRKLEAVAKSVDAIIDGTRKLYVDYGLEDQAVVDGWANMYQHYIPLMREDKDGGMGTGQGFSVKGKETKGRTGSTRKVVDILANVAMQREKLIVRGEKNIVAQALVGLAQANPNPDFWEVRSQAPTERVFDPKTGVVVDRPDPLFKSRENVAVAKVKDANGKVTEQMVVFNEDNPRAVRMAAAMKNLDAGNLEGLLGVSAKITRYFAAINTQYNPVFGVVNLVRDVQGAMVNLGTTPLAGQQGKIAKDTLSALRGIYGDIRKTRKGGQATSQWSQLWEQMQDDGGTTGYRELFTTSAERANNLKSILNPEGWMDSKWGKFFTADGRLKVPLSMAQKGATEIFGWLSDYNEAMENGVRLAAYKAALDKGMSREQAASLAKNLTVNFNRKGQAGMQAGAVYAFFNAAMQGTARIGQTLFDMDGGDLSTLRLSKTGKAVVYGGVMLGVMQALALSAAGFDDDDPPEFVRERSLIIPTGDKTYVSIPMPLGLHVIPGIGRRATEFALSGFDKPAKRAVSMVGMFADAFNPIGNAGLSMQTIAPTALDPLVALSENKDWTGKPIARVSSNKAMPGHTQWKDTATGFSKVVAEAINWISGGNEYVAGAFSPTPDQIDYLLAQVGGGVAREAAKVQQTISTAMSGETLPTHKIPLVGRFVGNAASQASQGSAFYANLNRLNELETEIKGLRKDGRFDEAAKLARENPQSMMIAMANRAERDVQRLRREKRELIANDASREQVRAKEDQITDVMTRLNEAVERRKAQAAR